MPDPLAPANELVPPLPTPHLDGQGGSRTVEGGGGSALTNTRLHYIHQLLPQSEQEAPSLWGHIQNALIQDLGRLMQVSLQDAGIKSIWNSTLSFNNPYSPPPLGSKRVSALGGLRETPSWCPGDGRDGEGLWGAHQLAGSRDGDGGPRVQAPLRPLGSPQLTPPLTLSPAHTLPLDHHVHSSPLPGARSKTNQS